MKRITDLTTSELVCLTNDQIDLYVKREMAEANTPLPGPAPVPPKGAEGKEDLTLYHISFPLLFYTEDDALKALDFLKGMSQAKTHYLRSAYSYSGPQGVEPYDHTDVQVTALRYWSAKNYEQNRSSLEGYADAKKEYDEEKRKHDKEKELYNDARQQVMDVVHAASRTEQRKADIRYMFEEYLEVAEGDRVMALAFMVKAGKWTEKEIREVIDEPKPEEQDDE